MPGPQKPSRDDRADDEVYSITSAAQAHSDELGSREFRYAISMGIRSICFIGGVIAWQYAPWAGVVMLVLAIFLPYTSVVLANAGVRKKGTGSDLIDPGPYGELPER